MDAQVRNIIKFQVVALLRRGKEALRDYGRQKLLEIQEKIPTADSIKSDLPDCSVTDHRGAAAPAGPISCEAPLITNIFLA